jgi:hypothetical protein
VYDGQGLVHYGFIPKGCNVNQEIWVKLLRCFMDAVRKKCSEEWTRNSWFLLHNNTPAHWSLVVKWYLAKHNMTALEHWKYFLGLSLHNLFLFPWPKSFDRIICKCWGSSCKHDNSTDRDIKKWLPGMFPKALQMESVSLHLKELLWRESFVNRCKVTYFCARFD